MAKTVTSKVMIACPYYEGELALMPQEAKDALVLRNPKAAKLFEVKG